MTHFFWKMAAFQTTSLFRIWLFEWCFFLPALFELICDMADSSSSRLDVGLERLSKVAGILLPITIAVVGGIYTSNKDKNDEAVRAAQEQRDATQKAFDNTQKQYANLMALIPLFTSGKEEQARVGLEIYLSEARLLQAPTDLQSTIQGLSNQFPEQARLVQLATEAGKRQQDAECKVSADGIYLQVANSSTQVALGKLLASQLKSNGVSPSVQGVQRIDQGPNATELRYYRSEANDLQATGIISKLQAVGIANVARVDLTQRYLKSGCSPPAVYELWIGASSPLVQH
jgi:hypothetical protein